MCIFFLSSFFIHSQINKYLKFINLKYPFLLLFVKSIYIKVVHAFLNPLLYHLPTDSQPWVTVMPLMIYCDIYAFFILGLILLILSIIVVNRFFLLSTFFRKKGLSLSSLTKLSKLKLEKLINFFP